jgi:hypothetical protein
MLKKYFTAIPNNIILILIAVKKINNICLFLLILILLCCCKHNSKKVNRNFQPNNSVTFSTYNCISLKNTLSNCIFFIPDYRLIFIRKDNSSPIQKICIYSNKTNKIIQTLDLCKPDLNQTFHTSFDDYNFDGYMDIYTKDSGAILGNFHGEVYLYKPETSTFMRSDVYKNMTSIEVLHERNIIKSHNRSQAGLISTVIEYEIQNNNPIILLSKQTYIDNK